MLLNNYLIKLFVMHKLCTTVLPLSAQCVSLNYSQHYYKVSDITNVILLM